MLTEEEEKFLDYWARNRTKEKSISKQLSFGLPIGLLIGGAIVLNFTSGWYTRANMVAYSQSTPIVLLISIILIAFFCSIFFKRHQWEMKEQRFIELTLKKEREKSTEAMQQ